MNPALTPYSRPPPGKKKNKNGKKKLKEGNVKNGRKLTKKYVENQEREMAEANVNVSTLAGMNLMDNCTCSNVKVGLTSTAGQSVLNVSLQVVTQVQFFCEGLGIPCVGLLGLLGNVAAIIVLR